MKLLAELKRRNVLRVAALYAAVAWLTLQVADVIVEPLGLPGWTMRMLIVLAALGFVVAIVLAWNFEVTGQGVLSDAEARRVEPAAGLARGRLLDFAIIGVLCIALAWFIVDRRREGAEAEAQATRAPTLAVLPFRSLGSTAEDEYFADGLSEELLNTLASVDGLRVAGRSSSFYFKGREAAPGEIGRQLGVAHLLEGSVRRAGGKLRVTAQLVDANDGLSLWSEAWDREAGDLLAIQAEISRAVVQALQPRLLSDATAAGETQPAAHEPNATAYAYYLVGRARMRERGLENLRAAVRLFDRAIGADRAFADAYAGKAMALLLLHSQHDDGDPNERLGAADGAIRRALELDPLSSEALTAAGLQQNLRAAFLGQPPTPEADRYFERALAANPQSTSALYWRARYLRERDPARTLELLDRVLAIDPLEQQAAIQRAATLSATGRGDEARAEYERILQLYPDSVAVLRAYAYDELNWGRLADSHALSRRLDALANFTDPWLHLLPIQIDASLGRTAEARARLVRLTGTAQAEWVRESMLAILDRDYARLVALDRAAAMRDPSARRDLMQSILLVDRASEAVEIARGLAPGLLDDPPQVPDEFECQAAYAALALRRTGDREQAVRVANAAFTKLQALPGLQRPNDVACRAGLLQMAERRDEALAEFTRAVDLGYRGVVLGAPIPLEDDPLIRDWNGDPRVRAQLERIRADLERQRREIELATPRGPQTEKAANG